MLPTPEPHTSISDTSLSPPRTPHTRPTQLTPPEDMSFVGSPKNGVIVFPQTGQMEGSAHLKKDGICGRRTQHRDPCCCPFSCLSRAKTQVSPHRTFLYTEPPSLHGSSEWGTMNQILCAGHLRVPGFTADAHLSLVERIPTDFSQVDILWTSLFGHGGLPWRAWHRVEIPHSSRGTFAAEISLRILSCSLLEWEQSFLRLLPSYQSWYGFFSKSLDITLLFS